MGCARCRDTTDAYFKEWNAHQEKKVERASGKGSGLGEANTAAKGSRPRGDSAPARPPSSPAPQSRTSQRGKSAPITSSQSAGKSSRRLYVRKDGDDEVLQETPQTPHGEEEEALEESDSQPSPGWGDWRSTEAERKRKEAIAKGGLIDADDKVEKENEEAWPDDESDEWRDRGDDQGDPEEDQKHFDPGEETKIRTLMPRMRRMMVMQVSIRMQYHLNPQKKNIPRTRFGDTTTTQKSRLCCRCKIAGRLGQVRQRRQA